MRRLARWLLYAVIAVVLIPVAAAWMVIGVPLMVVNRITDALHLTGGAYRRAYARMVTSRPPMGEMEFVLAAGVPEEATAWALAVRGAAAESAGLPVGALHAGDAMAQLWQVFGSDLDEVIFLLEKASLRQLPGRRLSNRLGEEARAGRCQTVGDFARLWGVAIAEAEREGELPSLSLGTRVRARASRPSAPA